MAVVFPTIFTTMNELTQQSISLKSSYEVIYFFLYRYTK